MQKKCSIFIAVLFFLSNQIAIASSKVMPRVPLQKSSSKVPTRSSAIDREQDEEYEFVNPEADQSQPSVVQIPTGTLAQARSYSTQPRKTSPGTATFSSLNNLDQPTTPARGGYNKAKMQDGWEIVDLKNPAPETAPFTGNNPLRNPTRTKSTPNLGTLYENITPEFTTSVNQDNSQATPQESIINRKASTKNTEQRPRLTQEEINAASLARKPQAKYKPKAKAKPHQKDMEPITEQINDNLSLESDGDAQTTAQNTTPEDPIITSYRRYIKVTNRNLLPANLQGLSKRNIITEGVVTDLGDGNIRFTSKTNPNDFIDVKKPMTKYLAPDKHGFMEFSDTPEYRDYITSESNLQDIKNGLSSITQKTNVVKALKNGNMVDEGDSVSFIVNNETVAIVKKPNVYKPKSLKINQIIDESNNHEEMNQKLLQLADETDDSLILNDIKNLNSASNNQGTLKGMYYPTNHDLYNAAKNKLNIQKALNQKNKNPIFSLLDEYHNDTKNVPLDQIKPKTIQMYTTAIQKATDASIKQILDNHRLSLDSKITQLQSFKNKFSDSEPTELQSLGYLRRNAVDSSEIPYRKIVNNAYDTAINTLKTEGVTIEQLSKDIATLKENSNEALSRLSQGNIAALNQFISNSMMVLWKRGAVTSKTIGQTLNNLFKVSKAKVSPEDINIITADLKADVPTPESSIEQQVHWFTRASNRVSQAISDTFDTMYGAKKPTQQEQNIFNRINDEEFQTIASDAIGHEMGRKRADNLNQVITRIIENIDPKLNPTQKENATLQMLQSRREWTTNSQFDPAKLKKWTIEQIRQINPQYDLLGNPISSTY